MKKTENKDATGGQDDITNVGRKKIRGEKCKTEQITLNNNIRKGR
jgi:hypothetical protein